jgi:calcium-dependent protein kinase
MELCSGGELFERIAGTSLSEDEARGAFLQVMKAIQYLHLNKICHRDLKPENIMFLRPGENLLKIIDFGISKVFYDDNLTEQSIVKMTTRTGTSLYVAPEV